MSREKELKTITITIDGKECTSTYGKTILQIARENGIYIPTMCYLTKVKPIASCRMCVVEIEGVEGMILSCQEVATDGINVTTNSNALYTQRQNIMKLYDVNHPLECGVCDKSGECDLQNKTLEFGVNNQTFTTREPNRKVENWGFISYDPALCIMCEKCVHVCNEIVGDESLAISVGGYKSTIVNNNPDDGCHECGECMSVCPVGALVSTDFKYSSNAWELTQIPASCSHCSAACELNYEVKHESIVNPEHRIYRVTNNYEFSSLCGAGRFGYDFENRIEAKDSEAFEKAIEAFNKADTIRFSANITNEEAHIFQKLKEAKGYKLSCDEAKGYQSFLNAYSSVSGKSLYSGSLSTIKDSKAIVVFGSMVDSDNPMVKYHISMASKQHRARIAYLHPIEDANLSNIVTQYIKYEVGSEEGVAALLANALITQEGLDEHTKAFLDSLDIGNLSAESNVGEEELEALLKSLIKKRDFTLVVGADLYAHPRVENIAKLIALIEKYSTFDVVAIPPATNALGVSLICDLDNEIGNSVVGYNAPGDFVLSSLGEGDLDMPALNQQEGTFTNINKQVVPTNVALSYNGYILNDIANALGMDKEYTIEYTQELPKERGFKAVAFDDLKIAFGINGEDNRGYLLEDVDAKVEISLDSIDELPAYDGTVVYQVNAINQFSPFTHKTKQLAQEEFLRGSQQFATAAKISEGDHVKFEINGVEYERVFSIDTSLKGTIAINPSNDKGLSATLVSSYRYTKVVLKNQ
jgi:NADH-quinone oxidoreductase subunit G